jgi:hypothetical protein
LLEGLATAFFAKAGLGGLLATVAAGLAGAVLDADSFSAGFAPGTRRNFG